MGLRIRDLPLKTLLSLTDRIVTESSGELDYGTTYENLLAQMRESIRTSSAVSKSANYTITDTDTFDTIGVITSSTSKTITLPTASANKDRLIKIFKQDSGAGYAIVDAEGSETINDNLKWEITEQYGFITVHSTGSKWYVVSTNISCVYEKISTSVSSSTVSAVNIWDTIDTSLNLTVQPGTYELKYSFNAFVEGDDELSFGLGSIVNSTPNIPESVQLINSAASSLNRNAIEVTLTYTFSSITTLYLNFYKRNGTTNGGIYRNTADSGFYSPSHARVQAKRLY